MKIVVPEDPFEPGNGDLFMEVSRVGQLGPQITTIIGKLTHAHPEVAALAAM